MPAGASETFNSSPPIPTEGPSRAAGAARGAENLLITRETGNEGRSAFHNEEPAEVNRFTIKDLQRGGQLVTSGPFSAQIGAYPETIKDTIVHQGVPDLFLIPEALFDARIGVSNAELEFPLYYNYYLKGRKLRIVCRKHQVRPLLRVLREALLGPAKLNYEIEYVDGKDSPGFPDLAREMLYFKTDPRLRTGRMRLADCLTVLAYGQNGSVSVDGVTICDLGRDHYRFEQDGESFDVHFQPQASQPEWPSMEIERFSPPDFGITIIGSGHGFDATSSTSGFIVWICGKGVLIDPPVNSTAWLESNGIDQRRIEDIILTHCHADHDSGTLQKLVRENRLNLYTTETVLRSFANKYRALTDLSSEEFLSLFNFFPVGIDQSINIAGAEFRFKYRLHTIPTLGFETFFRGKSFVYSCDTLYDPSRILDLQQQGIMSTGRADDLLEFPWHHTLILHEAGMPPVHTPLACLTDLPEDIKERLLLTHISQSAIPPESGLRLAPPGATNTIRIEVPTSTMGLAHETLDLLAHVDLFRDLSVDKAAEFLRITQYSIHDPQELIIRAGDPGDFFYMVLSGEADVKIDETSVRTFGRYDYFGEMALVEDRPRSADIYARTRLELLRINRYNFLCFMRGTRLLGLFRKVARNYLHIPHQLFDHNPVFSILSPYQRGQLFALMATQELQEGETLFHRGQPVVDYYVALEGEIELLQGGAAQTVPRGTVLGPVGRNLDLPAHMASARAKTPATVCVLPGQDLVDFFRSNPGVYLRLLQHLNSLQCSCF